MLKIKHLAAAAAAITVMGAASSAAAVTYTYVGAWYVAEGPHWTENPAVLSAQEAAALLFGGVAANYAISTQGDDAANIDFKAFVDGWGDNTYLTQAVSQSYKLDSGGPGYNEPYGGPSYSAYVADHGCAGDGCVGRNFAFRIEGGIPEPATWALMIGGFGLTGSALRRRKAVAA